MAKRIRGDDWEEQVLRHLTDQPHRSFKVKELQRALRVPHSRYKEFRTQVLELARAGKVASLPRRKVQALQGASRVEAIVTGVGLDATAVQLPDGKRIRLDVRSLERVVPGDRVEIMRGREEGRPVAHVRRVLQAAPRSLVGVLEKFGERWVLLPDENVPGFSGGAFIAPGADTTQFETGAIATGTLDAFDPATTRPLLESVQVLGHADHPKAAFARLLSRSGWPRGFSEQALAQAERPLEKDRERRDCTQELAFTIDPFTAKDHDDAVAVTRHESGGFVLSVHIADVATYVEEDSVLDEEALARATSVYPPGQVLPMLPSALSGGECSLHHGHERRTLTARIQYDASGARLRFDIGRSMIRSRASLSYEMAEALLEGDLDAVPAARTEVECADLAAAVETMHELAGSLRERRRSAGSLFVDRPEREFVLAENGHVESLRTRPSLRSHWIIEEFMLEANRAVAETLNTAGLPLMWRVHEEPDERKVEALAEFVGDLGLRWRPGHPITGHDYAELFALVANTSQARLVGLMALRSLMKARYRVGWDRHFGLAFDEYAHFTSPIRRYPDLHNHRWLHALIDAVGEGGWIENAAKVARTRGRQTSVSAADRFAAMARADHCSEREQVAQRLERSAGDIYAADYVKDREGETLEGMVVSVVSSGLFVELDAVGLDGFVGVEQLPGDWYTFRERRHAFVGERSGKIFRIGQRVRVLLEHVDVTNGRLWLGSIKALPTA